MALVVAFGVYDVFVQRKMAEIIRRSVRSDAIVSSLFPSTFHERLPFPESEKGENWTSMKMLSRKSSARIFFKDAYGDSEDECNEEKRHSSVKETKIIADLYPETTIMLLDLVGFTAWSSAREPSAVFLLLESIFSTL